MIQQRFRESVGGALHVSAQNLLVRLVEESITGLALFQKTVLEAYTTSFSIRHQSDTKLLKDF